MSPERRARLLDPAEVEFAQAGFEAASLNRILDVAGMSKGQAYHYIANKADLYEAVIDRALERLNTTMSFSFGLPADADDFWAQLGEFFARLTTALEADPQLAALARGIHQGPGPRAALGPLFERLRESGAQLILTGQMIGAVRSDLPGSLLVDVVFATGREIDRWFADHWDELTPEEALRLNGRAVAMIRSMCDPSNSPAEQDTIR